MKARLLQEMGRCPSGVWPAGTIIDHPKAFQLVQQGAAEPVDDECRTAAGMDEHAIQAARLAYHRTAAGIHPDDFEAFDEGRMVGYFPDGSFIPGPNWEPEDEAAVEEEAAL